MDTRTDTGSAGDAEFTAASGELSDRWFRFHNELPDRGILQRLSASALRVLIAFLRLSDPATGTFDPATGQIRASLPELERLSGLRRAAVYKGVNELLSSPWRLLEQVTPDRFLLMPGWPWACRRSKPPRPDGGGGVAGGSEERRSPAPPRSTIVERRSTAVERDSAAVEIPPARREFRARQPEEYKEQSRPEPGRNDARGNLADWAILTGGASARSEESDVQARLEEIGVRPPLLHRVLDLKDLTLQEVEDTFAQVRGQSGVWNHAVILARRLFEHRGLSPPAKNSGRGISSAEVQRLMKARHDRAWPRGH